MTVDVVPQYKGVARAIMLVTAKYAAVLARVKMSNVYVAAVTPEIVTMLPAVPAILQVFSVVTVPAVNWMVCATVRPRLMVLK